MRGSLSVVLALALATGCHRAKPTVPAWPAPSTTADDGGESIDPHPTAVATSIEKSGDDDEVVGPTTEIVAKPTATVEVDKPATVSPPVQSTPDEVIMSEEIIIEIDD